MIRYSQALKPGTKSIREANEREQEARKNADPQNSVENAHNDVDDDGSEAN